MLSSKAIFVLLWIGAATATPCNQSLEEPSGKVESPDWPNNFPPNSRCTWKIQQKKGNWIKINIDEIDISKRGTSCDDGALNIQSVGSYCGKQPPKEPLATNQEAIINFDIFGATGKGFSLRYETISCTETLSKDSGVIVSPNYPSAFPHNVECTWTIVTSPSKRIKVEFLDFSMDSEKNCTGDSLTLIDMKDKEQYLSGVYCGEMIPSTAYSKSNTLLVKFKTNNNAVRRGFKLQYSTVKISDTAPVTPYPDRCNLTLNAASGIIKTPNYPRTPSNRYCIWQIQRPKGDWIEYELIDLDLSKEDLLMLQDDNEVIYTYSGDGNPCKTLATKNNAIIKFNITTYSKRGFLMRYKSTSCNKEINGGYGEIYSPNYPIRYPKNTDCTWKIKAWPGKKVYLEFHEIDTTYTPNCTIDSVKVIDVASRKEYTFCGSMKPSPTVSTGTDVLIKFQSKTMSPKRGFSLKYDTEWFGSIVINPSIPIRPFLKRF